MMLVGAASVPKPWGTDSHAHAHEHSHAHEHGHSHHVEPTTAQPTGDHITPPEKKKSPDAAHVAHGHDHGHEHKPPTFTDTLNSHPVMLPLQSFMLILMIPMAPWMVYMIYNMLHAGFKHEAPMPTLTPQSQTMRSG